MAARGLDPAGVDVGGRVQRRRAMGLAQAGPSASVQASLIRGS